jgi:hypothetical protein
MFRRQPPTPYHRDASVLEELLAHGYAKVGTSVVISFPARRATPGGMPMVGATRVVDDDCRIDQSPDLQVGIEATAHSGVHHVIDRQMVSQAVVKEARQRQPGERWSHAGMNGGHVGLPDPVIPRSALSVAHGA